MVVVQIFTLVLTTALLRRSERTISPAPSPRFGGPSAARPARDQLIPSDRSRGTEFPSAPTVPRLRAGKTNVHFLFHGKQDADCVLFWVSFQTGSSLSKCSQSIKYD